MKQKSVLSKIDVTPGCWLWTAGRSRSGYGNVKIAGKKLRAHRVVYELYVGPIPAGYEIDHLCGTRGCVNPSHLEPVTHAENVRRSPPLLARTNAAKTHCKHGHEFSPENTYVTRAGFRACRACGRAYYGLKAK